MRRRRRNGTLERRARDVNRAVAYIEENGNYRERREQHLAMVRDALDALEDGANVRDWIRACALRTNTGAPYSAKNAALIAYQYPEATFVRGLKAWGAEGISCEDAAGIAVTLPGGRVRHVFDVAQTSAAGDPNYAVEPVADPARLEELESLAARELEGSVEELCLAAAIVAAREGIAAPEVVPAGRDLCLAAHKLAARLEEYA